MPGVLQDGTLSCRVTRVPPLTPLSHRLSPDPAPVPSKVLPVQRGLAADISKTPE